MISMILGERLGQNLKETLVQFEVRAFLDAFSKLVTSQLILLGWSWR